MLYPKLMLQKIWKPLSLGMEEEITGSIRVDFVQWFRKPEALKEAQIPSWMNLTTDATKKSSYTLFVMQAPNRSFEGRNDTKIRTPRCIDRSEIKKIPSRCLWLWSDSTTVLTWITKKKTDPFPSITKCRKCGKLAILLLGAMYLGLKTQQIYSREDIKPVTWSKSDFGRDQDG
ncbi:hypothetical protein AVEN_233941-1 [Araneus ventricosus]|uniref:Uncharacterized protein n=1 Tax=Araneus ventricosus TaxID=182803 RepID=A0A4Y2LJZ4_ARAVE|nr:hypothetical protein AVEN_233941-1 [Araneus ventricosus]